MTTDLLVDRKTTEEPLKKPSNRWTYSLRSTKGWIISGKCTFCGGYGPCSPSEGDILTRTCQVLPSEELAEQKGLEDARMYTKIGWDCVAFHKTVELPPSE